MDRSDIEVSNLRGIDMHCHADLYPNPTVIIDNAERNRIGVLCVTNAPSAFRISRLLTDSCAFCNTALGIHPELAARRQGELGLFEELLPSTQYVGEIGLDFSHQRKEEKLAQEKVFSFVLDKCIQDKPKLLTVHSRRAASRVIEMIGDSFPGVVILHWFSGTISQMEKAADCGMYFSVNSAMLSSDHGLSLLARIPHDKILIESDGPFVQIDDRSATPCDIFRNVQALSTIWQLPTENVNKQLNLNYTKALKSLSDQ